MFLRDHYRWSGTEISKLYFNDKHMSFVKVLFASVGKFSLMHLKVRRKQISSSRQIERILGDVSTSAGFLGGFPSKVGGSAGGYQSKETEQSARLSNSRLVIRQPNYSFGGVRRTSLLDEIICLQAMLFCGFGAGLAYAVGIPPGKPIKPLWIALGATGTIVGVLVLKVLLSGYIWLPWL